MTKEKTILTNVLIAGSHHHRHKCPRCGRVLYDMFSEKCEYCGQYLEWTQDHPECPDDEE